MKRKSFRFSLLASAMLAAMTLAGCSVDDNPIDHPTYEEEDVYEAPEDPLGDFMANFITTGEEGNQVLGGYGQSLDEADPTVLSIGVDSQSEAERLFRSFVTDTIHVTNFVAGNLTYTPTSRDGRQQGEIYFTTGGDGCIARVTFSQDIPQDMVSEVRFIDNKLWPNNDGESPFVSGNEYHLVKAYTNTSKTTWRAFFIETKEWLDNQKQIGLDFSAYHSVPILCVYSGGKGQPAMFFRYKYVLGWDLEWGNLSYTHDMTAKNIKGYGAWTDAIKGGGQNYRWVHNIETNIPDPEMDLPYLSDFKKLQEYFDKLGGVEAVFNLNISYSAKPAN